MNTFYLSLIIACYNEIDVIEASLKEIKSVLDNIRYNYEIIFVDDKSEDGTVEFLKKFVENNPNTKLILYKRNTGRGRIVQDRIRIKKHKIMSSFLLNTFHLL